MTDNQFPGREFLICQCGWLHLSPLPGETGSHTCIRCGRPSREMLVAPRKKVDELPAGVTISVVDWP
jgi:hypothetical protein